MKRLSSFLLGALIVTGMQTAMGQGRIVFDNDGYIVIDNAARLVIDNPNANAITVLPAGGNIVSESEDDLIRWNIGTNTGSYLLPWTTGTNVKIPLVVDITGAGTGSGHFLFSTHPDDDAINNWNNFDYRPSDVTNMGGAGIPNNSPSVIDRFWRIQHVSYTAAPGASLNFGYNDVERTNPGNVIPAGSMFAQQFDPAQNAWLPNGSGTDQWPVTVVGGAVSGPFNRSWTLATVTVPLKVAGLRFSAEKENERARLDWEIDELSQDWKRFEVERSRDGMQFSGVGSAEFVDGQSAYLLWDLQPFPGTNHYRLRLIDLNGQQQYSEVRTLWFGARKIRIFPNPVLTAQPLQIEFLGCKGERVLSRLTDMTGKQLWSEALKVTEAQQRFTLDARRQLTSGVYFLEVSGENGWREQLKLLVR